MTFWKRNLQLNYKKTIFPVATIQDFSDFFVNFSKNPGNQAKQDEE